MTLRIALASVVALALAACGVKSDLERPSPQVTKQEQRNSSQPTVPLGAPGGTIPPYPTGP
jgi:uncharacterized lipoprotein